MFGIRILPHSKINLTHTEPLNRIAVLTNKHNVDSWSFTEAPIARQSVSVIVRVPRILRKHLESAQDISLWRTRYPRIPFLAIGFIELEIEGVDGRRDQKGNSNRDGTCQSPEPAFAVQPLNLEDDFGAVCAEAYGSDPLGLGGSEEEYRLGMRCCSNSVDIEQGGLRVCEDSTRL